MQPQLGSSFAKTLETEKNSYLGFSKMVTKSTYSRPLKLANYYIKYIAFNAKEEVFLTLRNLYCSIIVPKQSYMAQEQNKTQSSNSTINKRKAANTQPVY